VYFPYLRGKRFELLAIRDFAKKLSEGGTSRIDDVRPIIEPVSTPMDGKGDLFTALKIMKENDIGCSIIVNPSVGNIKTVNEWEKLVELISEIDSENKVFSFGIIIDNRKTLKNALEVVEKCAEHRSITLIHKGETRLVQALKDFADKHIIDYHVCAEKIDVRNYGFFKEAKYVKLTDPFKSESRNADYENNVEEIFSRWDQYYKEDGYAGYSDYLTIGENYADTGFMPRVVAIHFTYKKPEDRGIWIRHFVSQKNQAVTADVQGKFKESLKDMLAFIDSFDIEENEAIAQFRECNKSGSFPGLGMIKKLSIMNHLFVVASK
jgi:hypothetical protein